MRFSVIVTWLVIVSTTNAYIRPQNHDGTQMNCDVRKMAYDYALKIQPFRGSQKNTFDALELSTLCNQPEPPSSSPTTNPQPHPHPRDIEIDQFILENIINNPNYLNSNNNQPYPYHAYFVDSTNGNDQNNHNGSINLPFASIHRALDEIRLGKSEQSQNTHDCNYLIIMRAGVHYLNNTIRLTSNDNNIIFTSYPNETVWISGGIALTPDILSWQLVFENTTNNLAIWKTKLPNDITDRLTDNNIISMFTLDPHTRLTRARYPNGNIESYTGQEDNNNWIPYSVTINKNKSYIVKNWWIPDPFPIPKQMFKNLSCAIPNNFPCKNNSQMWQYNLLTYGYTGENQTQGSVSDLWYHKGNYWTGLYEAGGWAFEDVIMATNGIRHIPVGMTVNLSIENSPQDRELRQHLLRWQTNSQRWLSHEKNIRNNKNINIGKNGKKDNNSSDFYYNYNYSETDSSSGSSVMLDNPGVIHVWHDQSWFIDMFSMNEYVLYNYTDPETNITSLLMNMTFTRGGNQGPRVFHTNIFNDSDSGIMTGPWLIDNMIEELDYFNEWYFDNTTNELYYIPNITQWGDNKSFMNSTLIIGNLTNLFVFDGCYNNTLVNLNFRDSRYTYLEPEWGVPSGGGWAIYYGAAFVLKNTTLITISHNLFRRLDGSGLFLYGYNRNTSIIFNEFNYIGDNVIGIVGQVSDFNNGFINNNQSKYTNISFNLIHEIGLYQSQSSFLFQAITHYTYVDSNIVYNIPRASIELNDGFGGNSKLLQNLLFNNCRKSGDHGPINTWDRMPFITNKNGTPSYNPYYTDIFNNFIICNYGGSQGVDTDDGSTWYNIYDNFYYDCDGLKMDYGGHNVNFYQNIVVTFPYDSQNFLNLAPFNENGPGDSIYNNKFILMGCKAKDCVDNLGQIDQCFVGTPVLTWNNSYYTKHGNGTYNCWNGTDYVEIDIKTMQQKYQMEIGSTEGYLPSNETILQWAKNLLNL